MSQFSKRFISLVESMKSNNSIIERREKTSAGRDKERTKRKTTSAEEGFKEGNEEFNMRSFIKALKLLSAQILGERNKVSLAITSKGDGSKYGGPLSRKLDSLLAVTDNLINNAENRFKEEGGRLEKEEDAETIKTWRDQYNKVKTDFATVSADWVKSVDKQTKERPVDADNVPIEKEITDAVKLFDDAQNLLRSKSATFASLSVNSKSGGSGSNSGGNSGDNKTGGAEITSTIKQGKKSYTKEESDIIMDVKKTIYDKLNKATVYTSESFWKEVYKNYPNITAIFGPNTGLLIRALKKDFKLSDSSSSDINPGFYKAVKGFSIKESIDNNWGKIVSFESFMKSKINEENDGGGLVIDLSKSAESIEKAKDDKSTSDSGSKSTSKSKSSSGDNSSKSTVPSEPATPFKTKEEGNKFREWVNKKYSDWAKENSLDASGPENNSYIRKAYVEYGEEYNKATSTPEVKKMDGKQMNNLLAKIKEYSKKVELQLTTGSGEPVILFYSGKVYGHIYNNYRVSYVNTDGGKKTWWGTYKSDKGFVSFGTGKDFNLKSVVLCSITEKLSMTPEESEKMTKADSLLVKMSEMIIAKFGDTGFWKPFKGNFNDDEDAAVAAFSKWYGKTIEDAYYNPAINRAKQLANSKGKTNLLKNTTEKNRFQFDKLINKLYGSSGTDNYKWTIYKSDGTTKSYSVDTDF
jgi:hypothetical protein